MRRLKEESQKKSWLAPRGTQIPLSPVFQQKHGGIINLLGSKAGQQQVQERERETERLWINGRRGAERVTPGWRHELCRIWQRWQMIQPNKLPYLFPPEQICIEIFQQWNVWKWGRWIRMGENRLTWKCSCHCNAWLLFWENVKCSLYCGLTVQHEEGIQVWEGQMFFRPAESK